MATIVQAEEAPSPQRSGSRFSPSTTPGQLRVESLAVLVSAVLAGLLTFLVVSDHGSNTRLIAEEAEPTIVGARTIQTSLAEANAAAATAFLGGGVENVVKRQAFVEALDAAAVELERTTRLFDEGDVEAHETLASMTSDLPRYAGLVETARTNNRQGFPVGAAYLDASADLLENELYPGADIVANRAAERYRDSYNRQRGLTMVLSLVAIALVVIVILMLVYVQFQLRRRFNRTLNVPLVIATVLALALTAWFSLGLTSQLSHLTSARVDGYEGTRLYLDLRGTGFGARADEARFLIANGAGESFETDFGRRSELIDELVADLSRHADDSASRDSTSRLDAVVAAWEAYEASHDRVVEADRAGERDEALQLALGEADVLFADFDVATAEALTINQAGFDDEMDQAAGAMGGLRLGSLALLALIAGLAAYGLQLRINEYR